MGWFDDERTEREKKYLEKFKKKSPYSKKTQKSVKKATARQREYEALQTKADVYRDEARVRKAKAELERQKRLAKGKTNGNGKKKATKKKQVGFFSPYVFGKKIKKKKQGRPLSRKRPIRL